MTHKQALSIVMKTAENAVNAMAFANKTPAQSKKYNDLLKALKVLKEQAK